MDVFLWNNLESQETCGQTDPITSAGSTFPKCPPIAPPAIRQHFHYPTPDQASDERPELLLLPKLKIARLQLAHLWPPFEEKPPTICAGMPGWCSVP